MNSKNYGDDSKTAIGDLNDNILLQRFIIGFKYDHSNKIEFSLHLQDSRALGWSLRNSEYPDFFKIYKPGTVAPYYKMNPQEEFFEIYDASIKIDSVLRYFFIKAGRQKIACADYRIFGPGSWGNTGRWTWDAVKLSFAKGRFSFDTWVGGTKIHDPQKTCLPFTHNEFYGFGFYGSYSITETFVLEPYAAHKQQGSADYIKDQKINRNWIGLRLNEADLHNFRFEINFTREFGKDNGKIIDAYGVFTKIGYKFKFIPGKPLLSLRYTYASGNKDNNDKIYVFDPVYGASDKYYGWMNIVRWTNLDNREIVLELYPVKNLWIEVKYNQFYIPRPDDVVLQGTMTLLPGKKHLGDELDIFAKYNYFKCWQFVLAFGYFMHKDIQMINSKTPENAYWIACQVLYSFDFKLFDK
ncbi:hypothetical protein ES705_10859 [subsurface metagenome]